MTGTIDEVKAHLDGKCGGMTRCALCRAEVQKMLERIMPEGEVPNVEEQF